MSDSSHRLKRYFRRAGAGSLLISIIVHVFLIGGATVYVVSSVREQRKASFQGGSTASPGPRQDVQHKVQMAKQQEKLSAVTQRLAVDSPNASVSLPDLPDMPGFSGGGPAAGNLGGSGGSGVGSGSAHAPIMPLFGFHEAQPGGTLVGNFYDFKQLRGPKPNPDYKGNINKDMDPPSGAFDTQMVLNFVKSNWARNTLYRYYQAPIPLYATQIFIPNMEASEAPKAYGVEKTVKSKAWMALYRGKVAPPKNGTYRFVGAADDIMLVKMDGRLVLDGSLGNITKFQSDRPNYAGVGGTAIKQMVVGKPMQLRADTFYEINILISEAPGGIFSAFLLFEEEGATYEKRPNGEPILPIFRVADTKTQFEGHYPSFMANGPVWRALPAPKE